MADERLLDFKKNIFTLPIWDILGLIEDQDIAKILRDSLDEGTGFNIVCAGAKHHHYWLGGLNCHVKEIIEFMISHVNTYASHYADITLDDIIISAYLHDFDKVWAYEYLSKEELDSGKFPKDQLFKYSAQSPILDGLCRTLLYFASKGFIPKDIVWSACLFAHGGYSDANFGYGGLTQVGRTVNHHNKLAVLLHMADMFSSQILSPSIA